MCYCTFAAGHPLELETKKKKRVFSHALTYCHRIWDTCGLLFFFFTLIERDSHYLSNLLLFLLMSVMLIRYSINSDLERKKQKITVDEYFQSIKYLYRNCNVESFFIKYTETDFHSIVLLHNQCNMFQKKISNAHVLSWHFYLTINKSIILLKIAII